jgi:phenylacetate-CoA ligase
LIRFATGDMSAILPGISPCGRSNTRIRGWLGRADQTVKVRAMFVHPGQVAEIQKRHPAVTRARLVVDGHMGNDNMILHCEAAHTDALEASLVESIRDVTKLRGEVQFVEPGSLPNDGKVIEDLRKFE